MLAVLSVVLSGATAGLVVRGNQRTSAKAEPLSELAGIVRGLAQPHTGHLSEAEAAEARAEQAEVLRAGAEGEDRVLVKEVANLSANTGGDGLSVEPASVVTAIATLFLAIAAWVFRNREQNA